MIQFNLLPAVKLDYIKAERTKRLVMVISCAVTTATMAVMILLFFSVNVLQKQHLKNLDKDIKRDSSKLTSTENIDRILTVQNQLASLPELHQKKPVVSRVFGYVQKVTPTKVSIAQFNIDFSTYVINLSGSADSLQTINQYVDTLKFTTYKTKDERTGKAFSEVVLTSFGRDDKGASYQINLKFDPVIFESNNEVTLDVPDIVTTRSEIEKPDALFQPLTNTQKSQ